MQKPVFVTGNPNKAKHFSKLIGLEIDHQAVDVDEIQSKDPEVVIRHKAFEAQRLIGKPVIVDDFSFWFHDYDGLPGPFVKFFVEAEDGLERLCRIADILPTRRAKQAGHLAYCDGKYTEIFYGEISGVVVNHPVKQSGHSFGTDAIFAADGYSGLTRAELDEATYHELYLKIRPVEKLREFLISLDKR